ncbi:MAG: PIN domain-containing protein, partial [Promethearchaeota archaeon]
NLIVIDANFILLPFQFKIDYLYDIDSSLEGRTVFILFKQILDELEAKRLREPNATKFIMNLKSGLSYLEKNNEKYNFVYNHLTKSIWETTDDFLVNLCKELKEEKKKVYLASNDVDLRRKVRKFGVSTIFLRQKKFLSFD